MAINPKIKQKAEDIRKKIFGAEVRESLASGLEGMSEDVESIKGRQGNVENQFQDVLDETTGKDVINGPEVIAARNGEANLKTRLDKEKQEVIAQLAQTETLIKRNADNPLFIPTYDGGHQTVHPKVLYFDTAWNGYKYWMAHTPYPNSNDKIENPSISVSIDGIQWFDPAGIVNPIDIPTETELANGYHMSDTHLVMVGNTMECWYRLSKNNVSDQILRKKSTDGITWGNREVIVNLTGSDMALSPAIMFDEGKYKMWYVSNDGYMHVAYRESVTGNLDSWSEKIPVPMNYADGVVDPKPWHLDVVKDNDKYFIALNVVVPGSRILLIGQSYNALEFNDVKTVLTPRKDIPTAWDNNEIYRSTLVKVGVSWRLYYSAFSGVEWYTGLLIGDTPYTVTKFNSTRTTGSDTINLGNIIMNKNERVYTQENKGSWLTNEEIKFLIHNEAGAGIKLAGNNRLRVVGDNPNQAGIMEIKGLTFVDNGVVVTDVESSVYYNKTRKTLDYYNGSRWRSLQPIVAEITANRPTTGLQLGQMMFDNALKKPIWWDGTGWRDATGATV